MEEPNPQIEQPALALNSCLSCKQGKRRCNRIRPACSTCARVGRTCTYEEDALYLQSDASSQHSHSRLGGTLSPGSSTYQAFPGSFGPATEQAVDPFLHEALRRPTADIAMSMEVSKILGTADKVHALAVKYFETIWTRMPMICRGQFFAHIPTMYTSPHADFLVLCLCIHLQLEFPTQGVPSMQSSLYVNVKSKISLLESTSYLSLMVIQARLLVAFYEMGHGISPGAAISISACASSARALGLNKKAFQTVQGEGSTLLNAEEEKRVWWAVLILDRFINLCTGNALFSTEDPLSDDHLPYEDSLWAQEIVPTIPPSTLSTPSDIRVGPFARECQISHLIARVLRHIVNPTSDPTFHREEALQLERTMQAFMPLLIEEHNKYGLYCAALGICVNGLFALYDSTFTSESAVTDSSKMQLLQSIESCALYISQFSQHLFSDMEAVPLDTMSPFIPYSIYQAAIVQFRLWKQTQDSKYKEMFDSLQGILDFFGRRWENAGKYSRALAAQSIGWPVTVLPLQGFSNGAVGISSRIAGPFLP